MQMRFPGRGETRERKANAAFWHRVLTSRAVKETALWDHLKNGVVIFPGTCISSKAGRWKEFLQLRRQIQILTPSSMA